MLFDAKGCPQCGIILRGYVVPARGNVGRHILGVLLFWTTVALWFAWLRTPRAGGELYAFLATLATLATVHLWLRRRADRKAGIDQQRYFCERCGRHYESAGHELREIEVKQIRKPGAPG